MTRRGGIPICFPQFGGFGPLSQHGFCRNSEFKLVAGGSTSVTLSMRTTEEQLKLFPHPFELKVMVSSYMQHHAHTYSGQVMGVQSDMQVHAVWSRVCPEQSQPLVDMIRSGRCPLPRNAGYVHADALRLSASCNELHSYPERTARQLTQCEGPASSASTCI